MNPGKTHPLIKDDKLPLKKDLVRLLDMDKEFIIDLRYATENNFTGQRVYDSSECYIHGATAHLLIQAKNDFKKDGFSVKVWDAYRPHRAQQALWNFLPDDNFVAFPPDLTKAYSLRPSHMNGMCVDITLVNKKGEEILMPTEFDCFSKNANPLTSRSSQESIDNALYLRRVMVEHGFRPSNTEWWHFFDKSSEPLPFSDLVFL